MTAAETLNPKCPCGRYTYGAYYGTAWVEFCPACNMIASACDCVPELINKEEEAV